MSEDNSIKVISFRAIPLEIDGRWSVRMEADADVAADGEYIVEGEIHNEASSMSVKLSKGRQRISLDVTPGSVELWYPKGYGYPHIYPCSMKIGAWIGNAIIGFRTASWDDGHDPPFMHCDSCIVQLAVLNIRIAYHHKRIH